MSIQNEWDDYIKKVYRTGLDDKSAQYIECRRAFYAGNSAMFYLMNVASEYEEDIAVGKVDRLHKELKEFNTAVRNGEK
ncbi:MAG TPA: hypothetical protein VGF75_00450 [Candidatus Saccharimonadales bacterium]|jgi:hypothetical protein